MTRRFERYSAYAPVPTTVTATTWGGWRAINLKCLGCKHHFLYGTASMCSCASRTLVRTEHGDECDSYRPREGAAMKQKRITDLKRRMAELERRMAELGGGECKIMATATSNLMYPDRMTKWYELSCGHSMMLKGGEPPRFCPRCGKAVK